MCLTKAADVQVLPASSVRKNQVRGANDRPIQDIETAKAPFSPLHQTGVIDVTSRFCEGSSMVSGATNGRTDQVAPPSPLVTNETGGAQPLCGSAQRVSPSLATICGPSRSEAPSRVHVAPPSTVRRMIVDGVSPESTCGPRQARNPV
jgi:hypothetical protein